MLILLSTWTKTVALLSSSFYTKGPPETPPLTGEFGPWSAKTKEILFWIKQIPAHFLPGYKQQWLRIREIGSFPPPWFWGWMTWILWLSITRILKADKSFKFTLMLQTTNSRRSKQGAHFTNDSNAAKQLLFARRTGSFFLLSNQ